MLGGKMSINFVQIKISYLEKHHELVSDELPTFLDIVQHYYYLKHKELEETEWTLTNTLAENVTKVQGYKIYIKGTVSITSCKDDNTRFTTVLLKDLF